MQHAPADTLASGARQTAGDRRAGLALQLILQMHPGTVMETWEPRPGRAVVDLLRVPEHRRRRGLGRTVYLAWEAGLAPGTLVELFAVDADASAFWRAMGFEGEDNGVMGKVVPGEEGTGRWAGRASATTTPSSTSSS